MTFLLHLFANISYQLIQASRRISNIFHLRGYTNTPDGLRQCREELLHSNATGWRRRALKRVLVLTDGQSNINTHLMLYRALQLKLLGVEVFVVAVGFYTTSRNGGTYWAGLYIRSPSVPCEKQPRIFEGGQANSSLANISS